MRDPNNSPNANTQRQHHRRLRQPKIAPALLAALIELARAERIHPDLLVTLLIRDGLDHRRGRSC
jgi:hypothetical protein